MAQLVDELFATPAITTTMLMQTLGIPRSSAGRYVARLQGAGLLTEVTGQRRHQIFVAGEVAANTAEDAR